MVKSRVDDRWQINTACGVFINLLEASAMAAIYDHAKATGMECRAFLRHLAQLRDPGLLAIQN
jgi:hypothetical protein